MNSLRRVILMSSAMSSQDTKRGKAVENESELDTKRYIEYCREQTMPLSSQSEQASN